MHQVDGSWGFPWLMLLMYKCTSWHRIVHMLCDTKSRCFECRSLCESMSSFC